MPTLDCTSIQKGIPADMVGLAGEARRLLLLQSGLLLVSIVGAGSLFGATAAMAAAYGALTAMLNTWMSGRRLAKALEVRAHPAGTRNSGAVRRCRSALRNDGSSIHAWHGCAETTARRIAGGFRAYVQRDRNDKTRDAYKRSGLNQRKLGCLVYSGSRGTRGSSGERIH